jgi:hypothetical protein
LLLGRRDGPVFVYALSSPPLPLSSPLLRWVTRTD